MLMRCAGDCGPAVYGLGLMVTCVPHSTSAERAVRSADVLCHIAFWDSAQAQYVVSSARRQYAMRVRYTCKVVQNNPNPFFCLESNENREKSGFRADAVRSADVLYSVFSNPRPHPDPTPMALQYNTDYCTAGLRCAGGTSPDIVGTGAALTRFALTGLYLSGTTDPALPHLTQPSNVTYGR
ncbi:hypothetical protein Bbelb_097010 [Branchiostoma belcheri]|nr:hypothetical protein Bbelb_097010 [Branchiostoma belcheri]